MPIQMCVWLLPLVLRVLGCTAPTQASWPPHAGHAESRVLGSGQLGPRHSLYPGKGCLRPGWMSLGRTGHRATVLLCPGAAEPTGHFPGLCGPRAPFEPHGLHSSARPEQAEFLSSSGTPPPNVRGHSWGCGWLWTPAHGTHACLSPPARRGEGRTLGARSSAGLWGTATATHRLCSTQAGSVLKTSCVVHRSAPSPPQWVPEPS